MIVSRSSRLPRKKLLLATGDAICSALAMVAAVLLRLGWANGIDYIHARLGAVLMSWGVFILAFYIGGLYESERLQSIGKTLASSVISVSLGAVLITGIFYATLSLEIGRGIFLGFAAFVFVAVISIRLVYMAASGHGFMAPHGSLAPPRSPQSHRAEINAHANLRILG
jgi:hypothetical protein